ncbi:uncharacterized protein PV06_06745 [Exophiala oligosperma]|uniref:Trichothecene 3-O-acetyltransferase-like N-terminal domain-containing protein n=1 Tax=Exophiala oligosperma TaxID=215243 RepID=A0A0D2DDM9_9EURO|nr:uncharacterized protein PV06_06745 [Exophiala oligosperma]KIW41163.1 hypothetical protein PV06_06745 [Exophiala oligosperma]
MAPNGTPRDFTHLRDVMGSLPMLKRYIVLCLCFHLSDEYATNEIEGALRDGLERLAEAFPFLAGQVVMQGRRHGCSGRPKIVPLEERILLHINDLRQSGNLSFPTLSEMSAARYPFRFLDPAIILPPIASSWAEDPGDFSQIAPVLILQANFVRGGLLLTFSCNHMTADMTGLGTIISLFAKACRLERFTEEEIEQGNQPRGNVVPLLGDEYEPGNDLEDVMVKPWRMEGKNNPVPCSQTVTVTTMPPTPVHPEAAVSWAYFNLTSSNLSLLKVAASRQTLVPYITTDDAVGALCWRAISRVRGGSNRRPGNTQNAKSSSSKTTTTTTTTFARPLSARKYLGLSYLYLGHMVDVAYESGSVDVYEQPLGDVAARLRMLLQRDDKIKHHVRAFATMLDRLDDKSQLVNGANLDLDRDVIFSSHANVACCQKSFGPVLGTPEAARRPRMGAAPSLLYLMPRDKEGNMVVAMCLREDDLMALRDDEEFLKFAEYIG